MDPSFLQDQEREMVSKDLKIAALQNENKVLQQQCRVNMHRLHARDQELDAMMAGMRMDEDCPDENAAYWFFVELVSKFGHMSRRLSTLQHQWQEHGYRVIRNNEDTQVLQEQVGRLRFAQEKCMRWMDECDSILYR